MTFAEFKKKYDRPLTVILLEGKRNVLEHESQTLLKLGKLLTTQLQHATFRSGNASGADAWFCEYAKIHQPYRVELVLPYKKHRAKQTGLATIHALDEIDLRNEQRVLDLTSRDKSTARLVEMYVNGTHPHIAAKAAYLLRDTIKVTGTTSGILPATVGIFYDDLNNPKTGGTGHTMKVCDAARVPWIDQRVWMSWLHITNQEVDELIGLVSETVTPYCTKPASNGALLKPNGAGMLRKNYNLSSIGL